MSTSQAVSGESDPEPPHVSTHSEADRDGPAFEDNSFSFSTAAASEERDSRVDEVVDITDVHSGMVQGLGEQGDGNEDIFMLSSHPTFTTDGTTVYLARPGSMGNEYIVVDQFGEHEQGDEEDEEEHAGEDSDNSQDLDEMQKFPYGFTYENTAGDAEQNADDVSETEILHNTDDTQSDSNGAPRKAASVDGSGKTPMEPAAMGLSEATVAQVDNDVRAADDNASLRGDQDDIVESPNHSPSQVKSEDSLHTDSLGAQLSTSPSAFGSLGQVSVSEELQIGDNLLATGDSTIATETSDPDTKDDEHHVREHVWDASSSLPGTGDDVPVAAWKWTPVPDDSAVIPDCDAITSPPPAGLASKRDNSHAEEAMNFSKAVVPPPDSVVPVTQISDCEKNYADPSRDSAAVVSPPDHADLSQGPMQDTTANLDERYPAQDELAHRGGAGEAPFQIHGREHRGVATVSGLSGSPRDAATLPETPLAPAPDLGSTAHAAEQVEAHGIVSPVPDTTATAVEPGSLAHDANTAALKPDKLMRKLRPGCDIVAGEQPSSPARAFAADTPAVEAELGESGCVALDVDTQLGTQDDGIAQARDEPSTIEMQGVTSDTAMTSSGDHEEFTRGSANREMEAKLPTFNQNVGIKDAATAESSATAMSLDPVFAISHQEADTSFSMTAGSMTDKKQFDADASAKGLLPNARASNDDRAGDPAGADLLDAGNGPVHMQDSQNSASEHRQDRSGEHGEAVKGLANQQDSSSGPEEQVRDLQAPDVLLQVAEKDTPIEGEEAEGRPSQGIAGRTLGRDASRHGYMDETSVCTGVGDDSTRAHIDNNMLLGTADTVTGHVGPEVTRLSPGRDGSGAERPAFPARATRIRSLSHCEKFAEESQRHLSMPEESLGEECSPVGASAVKHSAGADDSAADPSSKSVMAAERALQEDKAVQDVSSKEITSTVSQISEAIPLASSALCSNGCESRLNQMLASRGEGADVMPRVLSDVEVTEADPGARPEGVDRSDARGANAVIPESANAVERFGDVGSGPVLLSTTEQQNESDALETGRSGMLASFELGASFDSTPLDSAAAAMTNGFDAPSATATTAQRAEKSSSSFSGPSSTRPTPAADHANTNPTLESTAEAVRSFVTPPIEPSDSIGLKFVGEKGQYVQEGSQGKESGSDWNVYDSRNAPSGVEEDGGEAPIYVKLDKERRQSEADSLKRRLRQYAETLRVVCDRSNQQLALAVRDRNDALRAGTELREENDSLQREQQEMLSRIESYEEEIKRFKSRVEMANTAMNKLVSELDYHRRESDTHRAAALANANKASTAIQLKASTASQLLTVQQERNAALRERDEALAQVADMQAQLAIATMREKLTISDRDARLSAVAQEIEVIRAEKEAIAREAVESRKVAESQAQREADWQSVIERERMMSTMLKEFSQVATAYLPKLATMSSTSGNEAPIGGGNGVDE